MLPATGGWFLGTGGFSWLASNVSVAVSISRLIPIKESVSIVYRDVWTTVTSFGKTVCQDLGKANTYVNCSRISTNLLPMVLPITDPSSTL